MKYGDEEIGGKHIDYANMRFSGDEAKAREYIPIARNILGTLKHGMSFNNLDQNRKQVKLQDGTIISVSSAKGTSDTDQIAIYHPPGGEIKKKEVTWKCIGFVAHATSSSFTSLFVKPPYGEDYQYMDIDTSSPEPFSRFDWQLMAGLIPSTFEADPSVDPAIDPDDWEWRGIPIFWVNHIVTESAPIFHTPYKGSVPPISLTQLMDENTAQPAAMSNTSGVYQLLPTERNAQQHIGMVGKPISVSRNEIIYERSTNNAFNVVMPGNVKLTPDDITWSAYQNAFPSIRTINAVEILNIWDGEVITGTYTGTYIGDIGEGLNYACYAKHDYTYNTDPISQLELEGTVPSGTYHVIGILNIEVTGLFESSEGESIIKSFSFDGMDFFNEAIRIEIGKESAVIEELIKRVDATSQFTSEIDEDGNQRIHWVIT